jgi:hypothetical protein
MLEYGLPVGGNLLVFSAILFFWESPPTQIVIALVGLLMVQAGIWKLTQPLLPDDRGYKALRGEVDTFLHLVRDLNREAIDINAAGQFTSPRYEAIQLQMIESVNRMPAVAGKTDQAAAHRVRAKA